MLKLIAKIGALALLIPMTVNAHGLSMAGLAAFTVADAVVLALLLIFARKKLALIGHENEKNRYRDDQTGILNREGFIRRFNNDISDFSRKNYHIAYFMIDSNHLQVYHREVEFADVVKMVSGVLSENTGNYEFAGRLSESGFAMTLCGEDEASAKARVNGFLDRFLDMSDSGGRSMDDVLKASVYRLGVNDTRCESVIFNLRRNCAKLLETEENFIYCDTESMNSVQYEMEKAAAIKKALRRGEFKMYVQFVVDNRTMKITAAEALSRWEDPAKGILLPGSYLGTMMDSGMIAEFDYYMFDKVCAQLVAWKETPLSNVTLSCNFTRVTISEEDFVKKIRDIADRYDFDRSKLIMEITEETIEKNRGYALNNVKECKELGFKIALDDFCSGFTSPINLCEYPIDIVKVDRTVLLNIEKKRGRDLYNGLIALAHSLGLKMVCEGVESEEQYRYVSSTECDYIQGWYFSRAIPVRTCVEFVKNFSAQILTEEVTL